MLDTPAFSATSFIVIIFPPFSFFCFRSVFVLFFVLFRSAKHFSLIDR